MRTKHGGEPETPSYVYLRQRLAEVFQDTDGVNSYEAIRAGQLWLIKSGIVVDPFACWHEYAINYRQTGFADDSWYEMELNDMNSATVIGFAFASDTGYQTAYFQKETRHCLERVIPAQYAGALALVDHTLFSERLSLAAAQQFQKTID